MDPRTQPLDLKLAELSRDVTPPDTVWRGIETAIVRQRSSRPLAYAAAAAAACALLASVLTWAVLRVQPASTASTGSAVPVPAPLRTARAPSLGEPADPAYVAARAELETTFRERLALLSPATRAQIESNLAVIRQAHDNIRKALAAEPANPVLEQLFASTWHAEFDLYDRVVQTTQPDLARTQT